MPDEEVATDSEYTTEIKEPDGLELPAISLEDGDTEPQVESLSQEEKLEADARGKGWKPQNEWAEGGHGDDDIHLNPKEFLSQRWIRGKLRESERVIRRQTKELEGLKDSHKSLAGRHEFLTEHYSKLTEKSKADEIEALRTQRRAYEDDGEYEEAKRVDDQIVEVASTQVSQEMEKPKEDTSPPQSEAFRQWLKANDWFTTDKALQDTAMKVGEEVSADNPDMSERETLDLIAEQTKKAHPEVFGVQKAKRIPPVIEKGGKRGKILGGEEKGMGDFSSEEQAVIRAGVRMGSYKSEQEYINALVKAG